MSICKYIIAFMETNELLRYEIYPKLNLLELLSELEIKQKSGYYTLRCPECGKKEAYIPNKRELIPVIICNRKNKCAYVSSIWNYLKFSRNLSNKEVLELLAQNANVALQNYSYKYNKQQKPQKKTVTIIYKREFTKMPAKYYIKENSTNIKNFNKLDKYNQYKTILTYIYHFSLKTNQSQKISYYKNRAITHIPYSIGFLSLQDIKQLENELLNLFPLEKLQTYNLFNKNHFKYSFSNYTVIPSFELSSNLVTSLRFRAITQSKLKEIEISNKRMLNPLPFGMTYQNLKLYDTFYITEGHIDALSLGVENFVAIEGVNSFNYYHLKLFENKTLFICFDQDKAGIDAAKKFSSNLTKLNIKNHIAKWDLLKGKDLNELLKNGYNPLQIIHKSF